MWLAPVIFLHDRFLVSRGFCLGFHCHSNRLRNLHTSGSGSAGAPETDVRLSESGSSTKGAGDSFYELDQVSSAHDLALR